MKFGVYKLYWPGTPYYYIGSSTDVEKRFRGHLSYIRIGRHSKRVQHIADIWGMPKIKILELCQSEHHITRERLFVSTMIDKFHCLNSVKVSGRSFKAHSESAFLMLLNG